MFKKNDFIYVKSGEIFNQHFYWTKQPVETINHFIQKYTKENETVLDPFCGSGATGLASQISGRNCILTDISPASIHISTGYNLKPNFSWERLSNFLNLIESKLLPLYKVSLKNKEEHFDSIFDVLGEEYIDKDGESFSEALLLFESIKNNKQFKSKLSNDHKFQKHKTIYKCIKEGLRKRYIPLAEIEEEKIPKIDQEKLPLDFFFGKEPKRNFKKGIKQVFQLYSRRNLIALLILLEAIEELSDENLKQFSKFCFSSILFNCSLMSRFRKYENTSIKMGTFYIPPLVKDNNVYLSFLRKAKSVFKAKQNFYSKYHNIEPRIFKEDASKLRGIKSSSVDLIYADPPYGDLISYSELNLVIESWLKLDKKYSNEMIIDKTDGKDEKYFFNLFKGFLDQSSRVLKKNKYLVLIFHNPDLEIWKLLQKEILRSKFELENSSTPIRILSKNKTASQRSTTKKTQGFLVLTLKNNKKIIKRSVKKLTKFELDQINLESEKYGYIEIRDKFDFFINYSLGKFEINQSINDFLEKPVPG